MALGVSSQYLLLSHKFDSNCSQTNMELKNATTKEKERQKEERKLTIQMTSSGKNFLKREANMEA